MSDWSQNPALIWDERYSAAEFAYGKAPNVYFAEKLRHLSPGKILLPAEGEGRNAAFALRQGWEVMAIDISEEGKKKAMKLAGQLADRMEYRVGDAASQQFANESMDAMAFVFAHFPVQIRKKVYQQLLQALKPGGHVILEGFGKKQLEYQQHQKSGGPREADFLFSIEEIREIFEGYEILELMEGEVQLNEGHYHQGQGWVCRFFGRKP